jgi:hypothetical protein
MGAGNSNVGRDEFMTAIDALKEYKGIEPDNEFLLLAQLESRKLTPDNLDLTQATADQRALIKTFTYSQYREIWFSPRHYTFEKEFSFQVDEINRETKCNRWLGLYAFVANGYDHDATVAFCTDPANFVSTNDKVFGMTNDDEPWAFILKRLRDNNVVFTSYRPPAGLVIPKQQNHHEPRNMEELMAMMAQQGPSDFDGSNDEIQVEPKDEQEAEPEVAPDEPEAEPEVAPDEPEADE